MGCVGGGDGVGECVGVWCVYGVCDVCTCNCSLTGTLVCFYKTTGDSLHSGTSPVVKTSCPNSPVAKKCKNALFQPGT